MALERGRLQTFEMVSRAPAACLSVGQDTKMRYTARMRTQTATQTSQLHPMPRRKIWCHSGSAAFFLLKGVNHSQLVGGMFITYNAKVCA